MTPRERVYRAVTFQATDRVPYQVEFTPGARERLAAYYGDVDFEKKIGNHLAKLSHRKVSQLTTVKPGYVRDDWGVVWNRTLDGDVGVVENRVLSGPDLRGYRWPDPQLSRLAESYPAFIAANRDQFRLASLAFTLFERAWSLRGMAELLMDMIEQPAFVHELLDRILDFHLAQLEVALCHEVDCVFFGDDWGGQTGLIMGPALWQEFIQPRAAKLYQRVRQAGKLVMIHSCGDVKTLLPELVEMGVNIFNPFQPETMDIVATKKQFQGRLAFYGGISVQQLLPHGTTDEVRRETRRLLADLGGSGGYIAAPSHIVPPDVPPANIAALIEVFQNQSAC